MARTSYARTMRLMELCRMLDALPDPPDVAAGGRVGFAFRDLIPDVLERRQVFQLMDEQPGSWLFDEWRDNGYTYGRWHQRLRQMRNDPDNPFLDLVYGA